MSIVTVLLHRRWRRRDDETFEGSLPAFIAAFTQRKGISQQEAAEIRRMIDAAAGKE